MGKTPISLLAFCAFLAGCSAWPHFRNIQPEYLGPRIDNNSPLGQRYQFSAWIGAQADLPRDAVILTLSGGGTRAATLAYHVLRSLEAIKPVYTAKDDCSHHPRHCPANLAEAVILVSAISGGSFTGAQFVLKGPGSMDDHFKSEVLETKLWYLGARALFNPWYWFDRSRSLSSFANNYLGNATYKQLMADPTRPFLILSGADILTSHSFPFTQDWLSDLCTDQSTIMLGDAVGAAGDLPFIFADVELKNHWADRQDCEGSFPSLAYYGPGETDVVTVAERRYREEMRQPENRPDGRGIEYLHLTDGGLSDNLGARPVIRELSREDLLRSLGQKGVQNILLLEVNARSDAPESRYQSSGAPWMSGLIMGLPFSAIDKVTALTSVITHDHLNVVLSNFCKGGCGSGSRYPDAVYVASVDFDAIPDANWKLREQVKAITTFDSINESRFESLKKASDLLLENEPCFKSFTSAAIAARSAYPTCSVLHPGVLAPSGGQIPLSE